MAGTLFLSDEDREEFLDWILKELDDAEAERAAQKRQWKKWRRQREARPESETKDYPWPNASNVTVPLSNIVAQRTYGQLRGVFNVKDPFWTIEAQGREDAAFKEDARRAQAMSRLYNLMSESPFELNMREKRRVILYEAGSMGTCFTKVLWDKRGWQFRSGEGAGAEVSEGLMHWGPEVVVAPLEDVLYRVGIQNVRRSSWMAHRIILAKYELEDLVAQSVVDPAAAEKVLDHGAQVIEDWRQDQSRRMGLSQLPDDNRELFEVYFRWDTNGDGRSEECAVLLHKPTRSILQEAFNETGVRMFTAVGYMLRPFYVNGIGTCWLTEFMQDEADTTHNMRINAMHMTTLPLYVGTRGSGLKPDEKIRPGKLFLLSSPKDLVQIGPTAMPTMSLQSEYVAKEYAQLAAGMPDITGGFADTTAKSGDTYRGQRDRSAAQSHMFSSIVEATEDAFSEIGLNVFIVMAAHREEVIAKEQQMGRLTEQEILDVDEMLKVPVKDIPMRFRFAVRSTDLDQTYETKRQNLMFQVQLQTQFYQQMLPMLVQMENPQMPVAARVYMGKVFTASMRTLDRILGFFEQVDKDKYVPEYKRMEMLVEVQEMMLGMQYESQAVQMLRQMGGMGNGQMGGRGGALRLGGRSAPGTGGTAAGTGPAEEAEGVGAGAAGGNAVPAGAVPEAAGAAGEEW